MSADSAPRRVLRLALLLLIFYLAYLALVFGLQRKFIYPGWGYAFDEAPPAPDGVERWTHPIPDGEVHAYFAPAPKPSQPAVVLLHGNAECAEHRFVMMDVYRRKGFNVLVPEYRGFRSAGGEPSEVAIAEDTAAFVARLRKHPQVDGERVVYHGVSLGGGVAAATARLAPPRALVLQSTFTSVRDMARTMFAPGFLARDPFDTNEFLRSTKVPVILVHGDADSVIPLEHAKANAEAGGAQLLILPGDHGVPEDLHSAQEFWRTLFDFYAASGVTLPPANDMN